MALTILDTETVQLAAEVAALTGETLIEAVRQALRERKRHLVLAHGGRGDRMVAFLEAEVWPYLLPGVRGSTISKAEWEDILGYGPDGV